MSIRRVTYYQAVCDRCGAVDDAAEYSAWISANQADFNAGYAGWDSEGGNHLCELCQPHSPKWDDEHEQAQSGEPLNCEWCKA